jgi:sialic acid synthase SpsE
MKIIAEIGVNHDGEVAKALALIEACARAGADYAKFQIFQASSLTTANAARATYQADALGGGSQLDMLRALELSYADFRHLKRRCDEIGIQFLATPFDEQSALFLIDDLGSHTVKIGSGDLDNLPLLIRIASRGVAMIVSTGMSTNDDIELAVDAMAFGRLAHRDGRDPLNGPFPSRTDLASAGSELGRAEIARFLTLLHCTSEYPATHATLNMRAIPAMRDIYAPIAIGFSDHSTDDVAAIIAVTLGATVIERHITYDRAARGPDHAASLDEAQFTRMVSHIRNAAEGLGSKVKSLSSGERAIRAIARKRIVAARALPAGHVLTLSDIALKRSPEGRAAADLFKVIGQALANDTDIDAAIEIVTEAR